jgi:hypothetical protein
MNQTIQIYETKIDSLLEKLDMASANNDHVQVVQIGEMIESLLVDLEVELEMDIIHLRTIQ